LETTSHHFLIEIRNVNYQLLDSIEEIERIFLDSLTGSGATYIHHYFHQFAPHGVSGVVVIAESHLSIHTWPEHGYAAVDVFTCGDREIGERVVNNLLYSFPNCNSEIQYIERG